MIISILNQKGGTGKTTLAVNITREYTKRDFKSLLVDSDSQGSALRWHEKSDGHLIDLTCLPVTTLDKDVIKFKDRYQRIIIDGVPRISPLTICAIKAADLILIPVQPSPYDIWATEELVRNVKDRIEMTDGKTRAAFIVSRKIKGTNIGKEIREQLESLELPVFLSDTTQRVAYASTVRHGSTVVDGQEGSSEASLEIAAIVNEIEEFTHGIY
jgi:chromosome partitioning protein